MPALAAPQAGTTVPLHAEEKEAVLQEATVPGATFELLVAVPKTAAAIDIAKSPEALVVHLVGGELALPFERGEEMLQALDSLRTPLGAFHVQESCSQTMIPVAAYVAPKDGTRGQAVD